MAKVTEVWRCHECFELHDNEDEARECCPIQIDEGWQCSKCGEFHFEKHFAEQCCHEEYTCPACQSCFDTQEAAEECCGYPLMRATPHELEMAGQQRLPL